MRSIACLVLLGFAASPVLAAGDNPEAVDAAVARAGKDNTRALLVFGDDGVRAILAKDLRRLVLYEYEKVELPLEGEYAASLRANDGEGGFVVLLDNEGSVLARKSSSELAEAAALQEFLEKHQAEPLNAMKVFANGLMLSAKSKRKAFVHFSAPW